MDYQAKLRQLYRRRNKIAVEDPSPFSYSFLKEEGLRENKALKYVRKAMEPVEDEYRRNTIEAARKVHNHLSYLNLDFQLQGSVLTHTEIVQYSDIDLVVLSSYKEELTKVLKAVRLECEKKLNGVYGKVVTTGSKSIEVHLANPNRKVDVVVANWYELDPYPSSHEHRKGILIPDKYKNILIGPDYPFLRAYNINWNTYSEAIKSMVRFMKNFREEFEVRNLNSFQINCIAYNLPYARYANSGVVGLLHALQSYLPDKGFYKEVSSPCGKEKTRVDHNPKFQIALDQLITHASDRLFIDRVA